MIGLQVFRRRSFMIEGWKLVWILILGLLCLGVPMGLMIYYNAKCHAPIKYAFMGGLVFLFFALFLEQSVHALVFSIKDLRALPWIYVLYGALMAALFEEIPRYLVLRWMDKDHKLGIPDVKQYGIGHGGVEMAFIVGLINISNYFFAKRINKEGLDALVKSMPANSQEAVKKAGESLINLDTWSLTAPLIERGLALVFHVCLALMAFLIVRGVMKKSGIFLLLAFHFIFDLPAAMFQVGLLKYTGPLYIFYGLVDFILIFSLRKKIKKYKKDLERRPQVSRMTHWPKVVKDPFGRSGSPDRQ